MSGGLQSFVGRRVVRGADCNRQGARSKFDQANLVDYCARQGYGAVGADRKRSAGKSDRTLFTENRVPGLGDQLAVGGDLKVAVSRDDHAGLALHYKKTFPLNSQVGGIPRRL